MTLSHLIIVITLCGRRCYYHYFVDKALKALKSQELPQGKRTRRQKLGFDCRNYDSRAHAFESILDLEGKKVYEENSVKQESIL